MKKSSSNHINYILTFIKDICWVTRNEFKQIFKDRGVMLIFFVAGLLYPILYNFIYKNEVIYELPVAVVDLSNSAESRDFIKKINATQEIKITENCMNLEQARDLFLRHKVRGVVYFPNDYHIKLRNMEQSPVSIYNDMSSFLYYKTMTMGVSYAMLDEMKSIQINRYDVAGITGEQQAQIIEAIPVSDIVLYNPGGGFSSFLLPAILILIIHQTLFFGITMLAGTAREKNSNHLQIPDHLLGKGIYRVVIGKGISYFMLYIVITAYILVLVTRWFNLPHIGSVWTLLHVMIPFLIATIFFSMSISIFVKNRETGLITFLFCTLILLFLAGFSWPRASMPAFWKYFSYLFPSTHGIQAYIKINSNGANLSQVRFEYIWLWIMSGFYLITSCLSLSYMVKHEKSPVTLQAKG